MTSHKHTAEGGCATKSKSVSRLRRSRIKVQRHCPSTLGLRPPLRVTGQVWWKSRSAVRMTNTTDLQSDRDPSANGWPQDDKRGCATKSKSVSRLRRSRVKVQ